MYATGLKMFFEMNDSKEPIPRNESETFTRSEHAESCCPIKERNEKSGRSFTLAVVLQQQ